MPADSGCECVGEFNICGPERLHSALVARAMPTLFVIEDETHSEQCSKHATLEEAVARLKQLAALPWNEQPNMAPCTSWRTCSRRYEVVEYETGSHPWKERRRIPALEISAKGVSWEKEFAT